MALGLKAVGQASAQNLQPLSADATGVDSARTPILARLTMARDWSDTCDSGD